MRCAGAWRSGAATTAPHAARRNHNPTYDYFGGKGGDCTSFVSQALVAGGMHPERAHGSNSSNANGLSKPRDRYFRGPGSFWSYFVDTPMVAPQPPFPTRTHRVTRSFVRVIESYERLAAYAGGRLLPRDAKVKVGDIVYENLDDKDIRAIDHAQIITSFRKGRAYVTQHSPGYTSQFRAVRKRLDGTKGTHGDPGAWQYWVVRPTHTRYDLP